MKKLVAVVGPTAAGKSALAIEVARRFDGEIVNADSRLLYRGFDIGTAKPSRDERVGVPHHLVDILGRGRTRTAWPRFWTMRGVWSKKSRRVAACRYSLAGPASMPGAYLEGWDVPQCWAGCQTAPESRGDAGERGLGQRRWPPGRVGSGGDGDH